MLPASKKERDVSITTLLNPSYLKSKARWIRDTLDPLVARDGPEAISVEDALDLDQFLRKLLLVMLPVQDIRTSRIHFSLLEIAGHSTRWPHRLIERAEAIIKAWHAKFGKLQDLGVELLGPGGRLDGIVGAADLRAETMLVNWRKQGGEATQSPARRWGDLGFKPGDWWINPLFAFRDGIIDSGEPAGGIVSDEHGAYAILMTDEDETTSPSPERFVYRARERDRGRYRLTAATRDGRQPVRVLRSHTLRGFWSPRAGVRYDGLHRVTGWSIQYDACKRQMGYEITLERLASEPSMDFALRRPWTDEVEDYKEYKRLRREARDRQADSAIGKVRALPSLLFTADGTMDITVSGTLTERGEGSDDEDIEDVVLRRNGNEKFSRDSGCGVPPMSSPFEEMDYSAADLPISLD